MADCVPVKFALRGKTSGDVVVLGSWDGWSQAIKLEKSKDTLEDSTWINLPCGYYEYKFKINDSWIHDKTKPTVLNKFRTLNNFVYAVKGPGIVVSDTGDQAEKTVNDMSGDIAGIHGKQDHSQDTEESMPFIPKLDIAAPTEKQEGNEDAVLKVDNNDGMDVKVEPQMGPMADMSQESLVHVHVDPVSYVDIKPFEACQQSIEEKESHLQEDTSANVDKPKQEEEDENDAAQQAAETGGDKVITERQLQEVANYLTKDENLASEGTPKESSRQEGDASKTIQDNTEKVEPASYADMRPLGKQEDKGANVTKTQTDEDVETLSSQVSDEVVKETAPDEDTAEVPVTIEIQDKLAPVEEAYGSAEVDIDEKDTSVEEERRSTSIQDNQSRAEKASDETRIQEDKPVDKQEEKEENAADEAATFFENDDFTTERKLEQEVADYLAKDNKNLTAEVAPEETDIDNKAGDVSEAVLDSIDDVEDNTVDKTVSQKDQPDEVIKHKLEKVPDKKTDKTLPLEETRTKTAIECLEKDADEPVVEKEHSQYEKPLSAAQDDLTIETDSIVSPKTDKNDHKLIHGIPEIKAYVLSDEVPPQQKEPDAGKDLKKETPHEEETVTKGSVEAALQPGERKVAKAFDEIALTRDATNNVETMVHSVVEEITKTAIQEAGKDVGKTSPQERTTESSAIDDLKKTTRKKLTKASANQDVAKKAVLWEFNKKEVDKAIAGETPQQPSQEAADTTAPDNLKVEIQVTTQTTSLEEKTDFFPSETGAKQQKADKNVADEFKNAEVAPPQVDTTAAVPSDTNKTETLVERLHEKVKDEQPIVVDVGGTTEIKLGAMTDPETTEQDKPSKTPGKTTTEAEIRQNAGVLENIHKGDLPEKGATKDVVSDLGKGVETVADKGASEEKTTDAFVQENVEMAPDKAEEEMKRTHEKQEKPTTKQGEKPTTEKEKPTPKEEEKPTPEKEETPTFKEEKPTTKEEKMPTTNKKDTPTPKEEEKPTSEKEEKPTIEKEKPTTEKEEKPTTEKEEIPATEKDETPSLKKEDKPITEEEETPTPKEETPTPKEEEKPTPKEKPTPEEEEKPSTTVKEETLKGQEKPTTEEQEKATTKKEEKPTPKEEKPIPTEEKPTPKEETPTPKKEEKPTPKEETPTPKEEKPTPREDEKPTPKNEEKPTTKQEEKPKPKEEEKPTPNEEEKPLSKPKEEERPSPTQEDIPTHRKGERPTPKKEETPIPKKQERLTHEIVGKPTTKKEEKLVTETEEKPKALATPKSTEDTKKKEGPTSRFAFWKKKKEEQKPGLKEEEKPEQVKSTTEEPTTEKDESKTRYNELDSNTPFCFLLLSVIFVTLWWFLLIYSLVY